MKGDFLFPQIIYSGKTSRCLPSVKFLDGWHVTYTENHWANEKTTEDYFFCHMLRASELNFHLVPAIQHLSFLIVSKLNALRESSRYLMITIFAWLLYLRTAQPLDVSVNKPAKEYLRRQFQLWYSDQVCTNLGKKESVSSISLQMGVVKPLGAKWLIGVYEYMKSKPSIIINGFKEAGIYFQ